MPLAKAMLVFMVKGLFNNVSLPYAQFLVSSLKRGTFSLCCGKPLVG